MDEVKPKSLIAKLCEVCNAVGGIEKKGRNDHQKYDYVRATDVAKAFRHELFNRGLILTQTELALTNTGEAKTNSGGILREKTLQIEYTIYDTESDAHMSFIAYGVAMDSGDKAVWKAKTGALKYFLRGLGLVPDEKDDPEADEKVDQATTDYSADVPVKHQGGTKFEPPFKPKSYIGDDVHYVPVSNPEDLQALFDEPPSQQPATQMARPKNELTVCPINAQHKIIRGGISKKTGKPFKTFCADCSEIAKRSA